MSFLCESAFCGASVLPLISFLLPRVNRAAQYRGGDENEELMEIMYMRRQVMAFERVFCAALLVAMPAEDPSILLSDPGAPSWRGRWKIQEKIDQLGEKMPTNNLRIGNVRAL